MADWSNLPVDILVVVAEGLPFMEDFISFCFVCKSWKSVEKILGKNPSLPPRYPRLMLAETRETKDQLGYQDVPVRYFRNLYNSKTSEIKLPEVSDRRCLGTHYGWLMTLGNDLQINIFHPFSRKQISLPPFLTFPDMDEYDEEYPPQNDICFFVRKMAMSSNPQKDNDECIVVAIYGEFAVLAFARLGDSVWTNISVPSGCYEGVIHHNGKFHAVDCHGVIVVCDLDDEKGPKATVVSPPPRETEDVDQKYLVESSGDLLLVSRIRGGILYEGDDDGIEKPRYYTIGFSVFKLEECHDEGNNYAYRLIEVSCLGDRALFLGSNVSKSLPSSKYIKGNCIYFTDDNCELYEDEDKKPPGDDTGIFNMEDKTVQLNYAGKYCSHFSPPLWYI